MDHVVNHASTGNEAPHHLKAGGRVDTLFTDLVMPGHSSGVALARQLRPDLFIRT